jgi:hypothetical protein
VLGARLKRSPITTKNVVRGYEDVVVEKNRVDELVKAARAYASKPLEERTRYDLEALAELGRPNAGIFNEAFQRIRHEGSQSDASDWEEAADAVLTSAQVAGHRIVAGPDIGVDKRRDG